MNLPLRSRHIFVDASAYAATHVRSEQHHQVAANVLRSLVLARRSTLTTNFIVVETHALVLSRMGRYAALQMLGFIDEATNHIERVTIEDEQEARKILEEHDDKSYSYTDATSFAVMERLGLRDVFTFDRHFEQFGFSPLKPA